MTHPTDALRLVPKYYATEPKEGGGGGYWEASIELTGGDYIAAEIYGNDREEVEERLKAALSGLLAAPASPLPGGGTSYAAGGLDVLSRIRSRLNEQIDRAEADLNSTVTIRLNDAKEIRHMLAPAASAFLARNGKGEG